MRRTKKKHTVRLLDQGEILSKVRRGGRPNQYFADRKKEANRRACRGRVRENQ